MAASTRRRRRGYLPLAYTERVYPVRDTGLPRNAQRMSDIHDLFKPTDLGTPPVLREAGKTYVAPYSREGRRVSGYRRQRYNVMRALSGGDRPACSEPGCGETRMEELTIAHVRPDEFSGYEARSGGTNYARWMKHVKEHPDRYRVLCVREHGAADCRVVPAPRVHRRRTA